MRRIYTQLRLMCTFGKMIALLENASNVCWSDFANRVELCTVRDLCSVSQLDLGVLVPYDLLLVAENRVCEVGMEACHMLEARCSWRKKLYDQGVVGIGLPCRSILAAAGPRNLCI